MSRKSYDIQLKDHVTGEVILGSGGIAFIATAGTSLKATLYTSTGASLANPVTLNQGKIEFDVADTVNTVDIYGLAPGGQFFKVLGVKPSGPNEIAIDTSHLMQCMQIPVDADDQAGDATETATGFYVPSGALMLPYAAVRVVDLDGTETIDVGTQGTSDDPDGFLDGLTVATAGLHKGTLADGAQTLGVLLKVDESGGDFVPEGNATAAADTDPISYTFSAGTTTAAGFILLPYMLTGT